MKLIISNSIMVLIFLLSGTRFVSAQSNISVQVNEVSLRFPDGVIFRLGAESGSEIESIVLTYGTNARKCQNNSANQRVEFNPSSNVSVEWEWDWQRSGILPPGAELWWQWELNTKSGSSLTTPTERILIRDQRHDWRILEEGGVSVQWYQGDEKFGETLHAITSESREKLTQELGLSSENKVTIVVYPNTEELPEALLVTNEWTGGVVYTDYGSVIVGFGPDELDWAETMIPHELSHIAVSSLVFNCRGVLITRWLDEGLAEIAATPPTTEENVIIVRALEDQSLPRLSTLERGFSAYGNSAHLSYLHSKFIVDFLIAEHGYDRMILLLTSLQEGNPIDSALEKVYGFDTDQLDDAWRKAMGYPRVQQKTKKLSEEKPTTPTPIPTLALMQPLNQVKATPTPAQEIILSTPNTTVTIPTITPARTPYPTPIVQSEPSTLQENKESNKSIRIFIFMAGGVALLTSAFLFSKKWRG